MLEDQTLSPERRDELVQTGIITNPNGRAPLPILNLPISERSFNVSNEPREATRSLGESFEALFEPDEDVDAPDLYKVLNVVQDIQEELKTFVGEEDEL